MVIIPNLSISLLWLIPTIFITPYFFPCSFSIFTFCLLALITFLSFSEPTSVHYLLSNRKLIVVEQNSLRAVIHTVPLSEISRIWHHFESSTRNQLCVKLAMNHEDYNRGVLMVHVTDPEYYISTINCIRNMNFE